MAYLQLYLRKILKRKFSIITVSIFSVFTLLAQEDPRSNPQLTAADIAFFENIFWVKGRLPNLDGFRIKSAQLVLVDEDGEEQNVTGKISVNYSDERYSDTGELLDSIGELIVMAQPTDEGMKVSMLSNSLGNKKTLVLKCEQCDAYDLDISGANDS